MTFQIHTAYAQTGLHEQTHTLHMAYLMCLSHYHQTNSLGTSLAVQCIRIHLPLQGTQVPPLGHKSPHAAEAGPCSAVHPPRACAREVHARQLEKAPAKQQRPKAVKTVFKN